MTNIPIILASQSPTRKELLKQIHIIPDAIMPAHIDETPLDRELPPRLATRLAHEKGHKIAAQIEHGIIISADTVAACRRIILPKAETIEEVAYCMRTLSGCRHKLHTGVTAIKVVDNHIIQSCTKLVTTTIKFKRLTEQEIKYYSECGEGINKAGGYSVHGYAESFVQMMRGSLSNVAGLPLTETRNMLISLGFKYPNTNNLKQK